MRTLAADRRRACVLGALRRRLRRRPVAHVPAVAQPRRRSAPRTRTSTRTSASSSSTLPWLHYLVDFAMTAIVLGADRRGRRALPLRRHPAAVAARPGLRRRAGAALGAARAVRAAQGASTTGSTGSTSPPTAAACSPASTTPTTNAVLPSKNILMFIAIICAVLFFANVFRRTWLLPSVGLGAARALGDPARRGVAGDRAAVPGQAVRAGQGGAVHRARTSRRPARRSTSTTSKVHAVRRQRSRSARASSSADAAVAARHPAARPARWSRDAFEQLQQVRGYYSVAAGARRRPLPDRRPDPRHGARASASSTRAACPTTSATGPTSTPSTPTATA